MKAFAYVIVADSGAAPNFDAPMATLAICKPQIRLRAQLGDLVLAFTGRTLSPEPHGVCWAGVVKDKLTFAEYWADPAFAPKKPGISSTPDNIYRPSDKDGKFIQLSNTSHGPDGLNRDIGGRFVLAFDPTWYFGAAAPILPAKFGLRMIKKRRGHCETQLSSSEWATLRRWLDGHDQSEGFVERNNQGLCSVNPNSKQTCS